MKNVKRSGFALAVGIASTGLLIPHGNAVAAPIYGYTLGGQPYNTLEEVEAVIRQTEGGGYPLLELAFPVPNNFYTSPDQRGSLDYRPLGALDSTSQILTLGASSATSSYQPYLTGWPPTTIPTGCQTAACPGGVCSPFPDQVALVQCTFDSTWHTRGNFSWNRQGVAQGSNQITGAPQQVVGGGQPSGVLRFLPPARATPQPGEAPYRLPLRRRRAPAWQSPKGSSIRAAIHRRRATSSYGISSEKTRSPALQAPM